jgi:hypothetical protein
MPMLPLDSSLRRPGHTGSAGDAQSPPRRRPGAGLAGLARPSGAHAARMGLTVRPRFNATASALGSHGCLR